ncbi:LysM peptidoglycan-binding domain-containing M23 family metallopeptidase [Pelagibius litoralis]|uniref:LysM peptidoglycan-binding domain-containing M23 family metallopeptidase n=1 Tax=Pelagibius litoralis TaxID=374515 RepID=A0A967EUU4_9PROT|nr:LysM peptidoglycan-binding domain-containing M23 family metallopeptidase [Pelagibius litoralis]NIA67547.1 LysM peptidoglycan-binding domain-containing M23 family metallopeptidase [Pelagibius litoralis]
MKPRSLLVLGSLAVLLSGCLATPVYRDANYQTPRDPPQLPQRKPPPPENFAAWGDVVETAAAPVSDFRPSGDNVTVESLAPLGEPQPVQQASIQQAQIQQAAPRQAQLQPASQVAAIPADGRYVVAKGDSLYGIARRFGLPIRAVIDANGLQPPYQLTLGQTLTVPQAQIHEVAPGDTIFNIARRYDVDRSELVRLNGIEAPYTIPLGQKLILPQSGGSAGATAVATAPQARPVTKGAAGKTAPTASAPQTAAVPKPPAARPTAPGATVAEPVVARPGPIGKPPPRTKSTFLWPVQGPVLSSYGGKKSGEHNDGINIAAPRGTPVRAAENGVIAYAGEELKGFGKLLLIKHADGWITAYAHNERLLVVQGDVVKRGQTIARVGSSGSVDRPQLHFEVRRGTRAVNPETMMGPRPATAAKPAAATN